MSLRCKTWSCEICHPINRRQLVARAKLGNPNTFITLTSNPNCHSDKHERARMLVKAWRIIRRKIEHLPQRKRISFIAIFEATKRGEPHLHILCRSSWISQKWLSEQMNALTGAPICDIRRVQDTGRAAAYVTKYVGKSPHRFEGSKRYWASHDYTPKADADGPEDRPQREIWVKHRLSLDAVCKALVAEGFHIERRPHKVIWCSEPPA